MGAWSASPASGHAALLDDYCSKCHNTTDWAGGVAFDTLDVTRPAEATETWEHTIAKLRGRLMPPAGERQPSQGQIDALVAHLESSVDRASTTRVGHVPIQRLNRFEFAASVRSLLGVQIDARQVLPTDIEVEGFSNIAGALGVSPSFIEQHLSAARRVAKLAVGEPLPKVTSIFYRDEEGAQQGQQSYREGFPLGTRGGVRFTHVFPADGEYRFSFIEGDSLNAGLYPNGMQTTATMVLFVDGKEVARRDIGGAGDLELADRDGPKGRDALVTRISNVPVQIKAGPHQITATFIERSWAESSEPTGSGKFSGTPIIRDGLQVMGPFAPQGISTNSSRAKIFICQPQQAREERACAQRIARHLATQAFRRPATDADVQRLMRFYDTGKGEGGFDAGVTEVVAAVLSSPDFLYRAISSPEGRNASRPLSNLELASRLAFFLWNGNPDPALLSLANAGRLTDPAVLSRQVERMLDDPRAQSLVENFALAWLNLDELDEIQPTEFAFGAAMRGNFETEIRLFLASVLLEDRSVLDLINADWTFLNESLARHYGIRDVYGAQFRRVQLADQNRWGLLGKGAVLLRTSYADRTSPVLRGAWVLDRLVGTPPAPPPPDVVTDLSAPLGEKPKTVRARLEAHRTAPTCQGCHGIIDPPGLALENFDVAGRWREIDVAAGEKIDSTAELTSGIVLHGPAELRRSLVSRPDQFPTTVARRLMMYALNREVEYFDMPQVRQIVSEAARHNYTFESLIKGVVSSEAFRRQGADEHKPAAPATVAAQRPGEP